MTSRHRELQTTRIAAILRTLLATKSATRQELSKQLGLTVSSITKYISLLSTRCVIKETPSGYSTGGRPPGTVEINESIGVSVVVLIEAHEIRAGIVDPIGTVLHSTTLPLTSSTGRNTRVDSLIEAVNGLLAWLGKDRGKVFGVGVGIGGIIDIDRGVSRRHLGMPDWSDVPIAELISEATKLPVFIVNDVDAVTLGEKYYGRGSGYGSLFCVWLDESIGMGMVFAGELYTGQYGNAGELGHTSSVPDGERCFCGRRGCLETVASTGSLLRRAAILTIGSHVVPADAVNRRQAVRDLVTHAERGEDSVIRLWEETADYIATNVSDAVNLLTPELIVFRGGLIDGNRLLFERLTDGIRHRVLSHASEKLDFRYADRMDDIDLQGLASWVFLRYFSVPDRAAARSDTTTTARW